MVLRVLLCHEEYEIYWAVNRRNRECEGWVEKMAHPQVNAETYWYHRSSGDIVWERPDVFRTGTERDCAVKESKIDGVGPVWEFSIKDLKAVMRSGDAEDYGLRTEDLARRACAEFENFVPRVLSWHDYQYVCFWFFGGMDNKDATLYPTWTLGVLPHVFRVSPAHIPLGLDLPCVQGAVYVCVTL